MNTTAKKKLTIMLDAEVYEGIRKRVGSRGIGSYLSKLARPYVVLDELEAGYKAMANDKAYNQEAEEWLEGTREVIVGENVWEG
jgi:hypothetical protein